MVSANVSSNEQARRLLVATDLDATLLDHQTYSYRAALPAIEQLKAQDCPIIFNSSKTQAEQAVLRDALDIQDPFIIENGSAVVIPSGQLEHPAHALTAQIKVFGPPYAELTAQLDRIRQQHGFCFRGFADLSAETIAEMTGLSVPEATAAKQRSGSEPLYWDDSESAYDAFVDALAELGLQTTQGGRFRHVMAKTDKGMALKWLLDRYRAVLPHLDWTVVALGDSPNDLPMLQAADIGVLIPNPHRAKFEIPNIPHLVTPTQSGPVGWSEAIFSIIQGPLKKNID
ncbi:Glucosyl-3-phosphoglycerate/mannosyl-3- phosphoglycerate phosphatase [Acaryochloris thomasi RCC1774]|uniref:Glucosyl-3-phosphoglycerate/mannosyl-3-phosphoglycerate phosphatase n=1 Tax=Acaryochloris thomasi RCC1774 TaxID=1764569 RepID=A0A2W1JUN6_9CYAN|nr:HAD-IIB family hydrolase [Acaryochloris thomasi]PZD74675.1 Glucosyl-3-phosphoglycerate/mannosyl-3- phosphoglycerate phosphatase [Acaryochloris thomasi RCC1774]